MHEPINDPFYETLKKYNRLDVDYCLIEDSRENSQDYRGFSSHKEAVLFAMSKLKEEYSWISINPDKAIAVESSAEYLLHFPSEP